MKLRDSVRHSSHTHTTHTTPSRTRERRPRRALAGANVRDAAGGNTRKQTRKQALARCVCVRLCMCASCMRKTIWSTAYTRTANGEHAHTSTHQHTSYPCAAGSGGGVRFGKLHLSHRPGNMNNIPVPAQTVRRCSARCVCVVPAQRKTLGTAAAHTRLYAHTWCGFLNVY